MKEITNMAKDNNVIIIPAKPNLFPYFISWLEMIPKIIAKNSCDSFY